MSYTINDLADLTPKEIGVLCKENNVKSYTTKTLKNILTDLNTDKKKTKVEKKSTKPNVSAKDNQNEEVIGTDNETYYISTQNKAGAWYWKKKGSDSKVEVLADHSSECSEDKKNKGLNSDDEEEESDNDIGDLEDNNSDDSDEDDKPKKTTTKKSTTKKDTKSTEKKVRKAPAEKAKDFADEEKEGLDGNMYKSVSNKNGVYTWRPVK